MSKSFVWNHIPHHKISHNFATSTTLDANIPQLVSFCPKGLDKTRKTYVFTLIIVSQIILLNHLKKLLKCPNFKQVKVKRDADLLILNSLKIFRWHIREIKSFWRRLLNVIIVHRNRSDVLNNAAQQQKKELFMNLSFFLWLLSMLSMLSWNKTKKFPAKQKIFYVHSMGINQSLSIEAEAV